MNKRLYVGGLPNDTDDNALQELFAPYGQVRFFKIIRDFHSGKSKGFAFVEMSAPEEAASAIASLNGSVLGGGTITVSEASSPDNTVKRRRGRKGTGNG